MVLSACLQEPQNTGTGDLPASAQQARPGQTPVDLGWEEVPWSRVKSLSGIVSQSEALRKDFANINADIYVCAEVRPVSNEYPQGFVARFWRATTPVGRVNAYGCSPI